MAAKSILTSVKSPLGLLESVEGFDDELVSFINGVFLSFNQIGFGPEQPYAIVDKTETWADFIADTTIHGALETLMFLKVKSIFDPTASATVAQAYSNQIEELEFRLGISGSEV